MMAELYKQALLIRRVEETLLELFSQGKLNGTVHTCVGQEFSAVAFAGQLDKNDFIFSNHRCHGHFISFTRDYYSLIAEVMGKSVGTSGGIGSSQHLCRNNFFSNGVQGGIVPVAAGYALANKLKKSNTIGIVFIGDGTLGQGVFYETLNILSKWDIPLLVVCENNYYAQTTHQSLNLAGDIVRRAGAFGLETFKGDTWNVPDLVKVAKDAINYVRHQGRPAFCLVETYRLNPHSKGDDTREKQEIDRYRDMDPLNIYKRENPVDYEKTVKRVNRKITHVLNELKAQPELPLEAYFQNSKATATGRWQDIQAIDRRQVELINDFFQKAIAADKRVLFLGEDVLSPYGGAFKVANGLSDKFPAQVLTTPISEAAITGIANGLALGGFKPFLEIMFGDFMTLTMDQLVNHAAKFYHMYNKQITCPIVVRTPMGGRRGYGPTHSQTLDKMLLGIDNVTVVALNTLTDPADIYRTVLNEKHPVVVLENKTDYWKKIAQKKIPNYHFQVLKGAYPVVRVSPVRSVPTVTIVTYGGMTDIVLDSVLPLFMQHDVKAQVFVFSKIYPLDAGVINDSVGKTRRLYIVEEGSPGAGWGSEVIARVAETVDVNFKAQRIAALPVPIPSAKSLEAKVLPGKQTILDTIGATL